jgi:hypothetical protein
MLTQFRVVVVLRRAEDLTIDGDGHFVVAIFMRTSSFKVRVSPLIIVFWHACSSFWRASQFT